MNIAQSLPSHLRLGKLALLVSTAALMPVAAFAQDAEEPAQEEESTSALDSINEILVTGTKTKDAENVQDVPLAVTAFNAGTLEAFKIRDISGLSFQAPSVSLDQVGTSRGTANFSVRGLGINSSIPSIDPTVGVFVDGVYLGINGGVVFDLFDLDSVEVLRGPQGVLFGRNVTGGAVVINTGNPTEDFRGKFRAAVDGPIDSGRGGANYTVSGVISGPIVEDVLLFKVGAYYNKDEGYFRNLAAATIPTLSENHGKAETKILRGALEARLGGLTLLGKLDYFESDGDGPSAQNRGFFDRNSYDLSIDNPGSYANEIWTGSLTATMDIGAGTLTNVFGWRKYDATTDGDIDATPRFLFHSTTETAQEQFSNELRYAISTEDGLDLTFGGFWFDQNLAYTERRQLPLASPLQFFGGGRQDHEVLGVFANAQYEVLDGLSVIAGIRWNQETKDAGVTYVRPRPACSVVQGTCPTSGRNPILLNPVTGATTENNGFTDRVRFRNVSPKLGLQYEFGDSQIYGHWSRGFRSGGYNFRITNANAFEQIALAPGGSLAFDEEKVDTYEVGGKFQTADGVFTFNIAGYITKIDNMQREVNQSSPTAGVAQSIFNTANASINGIEAEARLRASDSLILTANIGVIDAEYTEILFDISGDGAINERDLALSLPRVPPVTVGAGLIHELELGNGGLLTRVNYQYRDVAAYTDDNFGWLNDVHQLEANITWTTPVDGLSISLYGRNLLDSVQEGGDTQVPFGGPLSTGVRLPFADRPAAGTFSPLLRGRNVGVEALFEF
ncbi:TonB-dependent receptor [Erythrobacter sp. BLCC-B19]|uniref:TonB-dependent receptor n=1 Tax=Erythrobacter sp. BLCC-B19 TaxID=3025315 RepID=UPI002361E4CB|nr:TonB-dependent receptor [Erythrobacter sp. BLCC-B19]WDA42525.1 TonB-dependent receptor plug domain-containing protein [Erythrobacter sp. BLCC-B19]